ncbi:protein-methionine-sulfoxide reductase heme-binding subunit MsrQ [Microbulbifer pacificus]|uniref:Protein-methionine-sulfoxide reductase heme-binding subunit MsrQ n=1 Tax=Microbulbifer pacificus TaxID=407164 RepID=A0AAU0N1Y1_9GAMM|nr:protein-methionine-sulfoxide reductase heme-binding subunit MsrQ [Microbulbifer pacificus]WOX06790.1 protein-methionine-sulfoxide reductase heme-binding subunit MsrQ [Microbulbifer pacificus]
MAAISKNAVAGLLQIGVHIGALLPLLWLFYAINAGRLGGDPVVELIHYLGMGTIRLLLLTLLVSPLAKSLRFGQLNRLRRPLGLWCFVWASLHFSAWLALDLGLDWSLIGEELVKRTYILLGFTCWLILLALAITSIPALLRKMGKNWKKLHGLLYVAVLLACWHFWWSVKSGWIEPAIYLVVALLLLLWRKNSVIRWMKSFGRSH